MTSSDIPPPPPPYSSGRCTPRKPEFGDRVPQLVGPTAGAGLLGEVLVAELRPDVADGVAQHLVFGRFGEVHGVILSGAGARPYRRPPCASGNVEVGPHCASVRRPG